MAALAKAAREGRKAAPLSAPRHRAHWRLALVILGVDHDMALGGLSGAFGAQIVEVAHGEMDDAALARRHRGEGIRHARFADALRRHVGGQAQLLQAAGPEVLAVEADLLVL